MEFGAFLTMYLKNRKMSIRKFAETIDVSPFRVEKWRKGFRPSYEDGIKVNRYFGVKDFQNLSEDFLKTFEPGKKKASETDDVSRMKDLLIEEKDRRIHSLEETINLLKEALGKYEKAKKS